MYLTFDAELYIPLRGDREFLRVQHATWERVLDSLREARVRVTHFVTGEFAKTYPGLLERMNDDAHEIASHSITHSPLRELGWRGFVTEVRESKRLLEDLTGQSVIGFRAPFGQVPDDLAKILHDSGYMYDSSIIPTLIPGRFSNLAAPKRPYRASFENVRKRVGSGPVVELPLAITPLLRIPLSGFFLSGLAPLLKNLANGPNCLRVVFLHPYDFVDLKRNKQAYLWDRLKLTVNNWALLSRYLDVMRNTDVRLKYAIDHIQLS
jgi:hypothetical protein